MSTPVGVLVVEDSPVQAKLIKYRLEAAGYAVTGVRNGREALEELRVARPAIVITDVVMPEMDGFELCRRVKADPALTGTPVLILTALNDPRDVVRALEVQADGFVTKPYRDEFLLARVRQMLANAELWRASSGDDNPEVLFGEQRYRIASDRRQIIALLLATYENAVEQNAVLDRANLDLREALVTIRTLQANFRTLLDSDIDAIAVVGVDGSTRYLNPAAEVLFAPSHGELLGRPFPLPLTLGEVKEVRFAQADGERIGEIRVSETTWGPDPAFLASIRDVTDSVRLREELRNLSLTDPLTGLNNRRGFVLLFKQQMRMARRAEHELKLLYVDVDGLKEINDTLGHEEGDRVIVDAAALMRTTFRESDLIGRLGGDEFAVLAIGVPQAGADVCVNRLQVRIADFNEAATRRYRLSLSIGVITVDPNEQGAVDSLLRQADEQMYAQKQANRASRGSFVR